jgi:hypothetical protein
MIAAPVSHLYRTGEIVTLDSRAGYSLKSDLTFMVVAQLPPLGSDLQYRIKSIDEPHARVALEHHLIRALPRSGSVPDVFPGA